MRASLSTLQMVGGPRGTRDLTSDLTSDRQPARCGPSGAGDVTPVEPLVRRGDGVDGDAPRGAAGDQEAVFVEVGRHVGGEGRLGSAAKGHVVALRHGEGGALQGHGAV